MQRLIVAVVLLLAVIGLCVICLTAMNQRIDRLLIQLDKIDADILAEDRAAAVRDARQFSKDFKKETALFPTFIPHEHLEPPEESAVLLPALAESDWQAFLAEAVRCRCRLLALRRSEQLTWENIF